MSRTAFFITFYTLHPDYEANINLRFRLRLLKFTIMFTKRSAPDVGILPGPVLQNLRHQRQEQATSFRLGNRQYDALHFPNSSEHPVPLDPKENWREIIGYEPTAGIRPPKTLKVFQPAVSLLDTIPLFMALSALQMSMQEGTITDTWMRLAAGYMAQAVAEQYLVYGSQRQEMLQEAFSWGFDPECCAEEGTDEFQINAMFWGIDAVVDGWDQIRDAHVHAVSLKSNLSCASAYKYFAGAYTAGRS